MAAGSCRGLRLSSNVTACFTLKNIIKVIFEVLIKKSKIFEHILESKKFFLHLYMRFTPMRCFDLLFGLVFNKLPQKNKVSVFLN